MESPQIVLLMIVSACVVAFAVWLLFGLFGCLKEEVELQTPNLEQKPADVTPVGLAMTGLAGQIEHDLYFGKKEQIETEQMPEFKYTITYVDGATKKKNPTKKRKPSKKKPKKKSKR